MKRKLTLFVASGFGLGLERQKLLIAYEPHIPCPVYPEFPQAYRREDVLKMIDEA